MERPVRRHGTGYGRPAGTVPTPTRGRPATGRKQKERGMLRLDDETFDALNARAEREGKPRADVVRDAIAHWLARE